MLCTWLSICQCIIRDWNHSHTHLHTIVSAPSPCIHNPSPHPPDLPPTRHCTSVPICRESRVDRCCHVTTCKQIADESPTNRRDDNCQINLCSRRPGCGVERRLLTSPDARVPSLLSPPSVTLCPACQSQLPGCKQEHVGGQKRWENLNTWNANENDVCHLNNRFCRVYYKFSGI
jgi:hypothetical protein